MAANGAGYYASSGSSVTDSYSVHRFVVTRVGNQKEVKVLLGNKDLIAITDLAEVPSYSEFFDATPAQAQDFESELFREFAKVFIELKRAKIELEGEFSCVNRLLNIRHKDTTLKASKGFLYYNQDDDRETYGTMVSTTVNEIPLPATRVHIEERKTDRHGRTNNRLTLRKQTLYLVRGLSAFVQRQRPFHREIHTFRAPRAYVDQMLMCDAYNYPKVEHLSLTRETSRGRELITQLQRRAGSICDKCLAKTDALYYEDCHSDLCSVSGTLDYCGPTARIVSNDVLFSRFGTVRTRGVEIQHRRYVPVLRAASLVARLYRNSRRDFVSEIIRTSRLSSTSFLLVANVSQRIRSYFNDENTCYMFALGPRGQLAQSEPLDIDLSIEMISTEIDGQYVDRVNLSNFSLTQRENGIYHVSPSEEPYTGPKDLGEVKWDVEDRNN